LNRFELVWLDLGKIEAKFEEKLGLDLGKIKILHPLKHSISQERIQVKLYLGKQVAKSLMRFLRIDHLY